MTTKIKPLNPDSEYFKNLPPLHREALDILAGMLADAVMKDIEEEKQKKRDDAQG